MEKFLEMIQREDGCLSLGRMCAFATFVLWFAATVYLIVRGLYWTHYETLTIAAIGNLLVQLANKTVESRLFKVSNDRQMTGK